MVKVLKKALSLVELLAKSENGERITDLGNTLALDKATIYRLLKTLKDEGYVSQEKDTGRYALSAKFWYIGSQTVGRRTLAEIARPVMKSVSAASGNTVYVALLIGHEAVIFDKVEVEHPYRAPPTVGAALPLYAGASGKAILAYQSDAFIAEIAKAITPLTPHTLADEPSLRADIERTRAAGFAINHQELRLGVSGVAAPIRFSDGEVRASIAMSGMSESIEPKIAEWSTALLAAAREITERLGGAQKPF
ncbi:MAG TPA: IclR family transcriptional regulator [Devosia sp.]|nr:IclR family transcriptional regulator [Devosia sp.]